MMRCAKGCHAGEEESPPPRRQQESVDQYYYPRAAPDQYYQSSSMSTSLSSQSSLRSLPSLEDLHLIKQPSALRHHCVLTLCGHSSYVSALAADGGGSVLHSGSADGEIRSWRPLGRRSCDSGHVVVAVCGSAVKSLVASRGRLFGARQDRRIHVWQIRRHRDQASTRGAGTTYRLAATLPTAGDRLLSLLSSGPESYVAVRRRHKKCSTWVHHVDAVSALALSHDGALLFSASWDRTFKVWRTSDGKCLESVSDAHHDAVNAIVVSGDGTAYTGSADTTVRVWRRRPGETKHSLAGTLERHRSAVNALALSPDGSVLYSGACDRSVVVWEEVAGESSSSTSAAAGGSSSSSTPIVMVAAGALRGHTKAVLCLATVGRELVCSGSADTSARVWRRAPDKTYSCLAVLEGHRGPVKCLAAAAGAELLLRELDDEKGTDACGGVFPDVVTIYTGSLDCDIKVWRVYAPS